MALALALATTSSVSMAAPLPIVNPGFEDISGESPTGPFTFGPLLGWDLYDPGLVANGGDGPSYFMGTLTPVELDPVNNPGVYDNFTEGAPEGVRLGITFNFAATGGQSEWGMTQILAPTETLELNTTYTLRVLVGNIATPADLSFPLDGFPGYRVDLIAGGVVIAQDLNTLSGSIPNGEFRETEIQLTTGTSHPQQGTVLAIRLVNLNLIDPAFPASDLEVNFDDIRLDASPALAPVPGLFPPVAGLLGVILWVSAMYGHSRRTS